MSRGRRSKALSAVSALAREELRQDEAEQDIDTSGLSPAELAELEARCDEFVDLESLSGFDLYRLSFLYFRAASAPPETTSMELRGWEGEDSRTPRAYYRAHHGEPVPGVDQVDDPSSYLSEGSLRRLEEIDEANPGVDVRAMLRDVVNSREGEVKAQLRFMDSETAGTSQLQHLADHVWSAFRAERRTT